jgi:hypothetical protein
MNFPVYPLTMTFDERETAILLGVLLNITALVSENDISALVGSSSAEINALWVKVRGFRDADEMLWISGGE